MAYSIELVEGLPVIRVVFRGSVSLEDRVAALEGVIARQSTSSYRRLLVDLTDAEVTETSTSETLVHASRIARDPVIRGMRIAYIGAPALSSSLESLAALRGYFYQRFRSQVSALRWLCGEGALPRAA